MTFVDKKVRQLAGKPKVLLELHCTGWASVEGRPIQYTFDVGPHGLNGTIQLSGEDVVSVWQKPLPETVGSVIRATDGYGGWKVFIREYRWKSCAVGDYYTPEDIYAYAVDGDITVLYEGEK